MTLAAIKPGDIIRANVRGREFYALVVEKANRELQVTPLDPRINYFHVRSRDVIDHWRKRARA